MFDSIETIPADGSTLELEEYGLKIQITEIKERRLETAIVYLNQDTVIMKINKM